MILVDINQVMISNIFMQMRFGGSDNALDEGMIRHMVLNGLRSYKRKFGDKYGEMIICADDRHYWRKEMFPYYKAGRKGTQDKDTIDWQELFRILNKVRDEVRNHFPWKMIQVEHAEADDCIGTLCYEFGIEFGGGEPILILSSDKDFVQLQKFSNVDQYSPIQKKWVKEKNPERYLREHIMAGDKGDGIPNFLSDDNCLVEDSGVKKTLGKVKIGKWINQAPEDFCDEKMLRGWKRNEALIDLALVPDNVKHQVMKQYNTEHKPTGDLFSYFITNKLKHLMKDIRDFQ
jgi:5'-3' exonuclease